MSTPEDFSPDNGNELRPFTRLTWADAAWGVPGGYIGVIGGALLSQGHEKVNTQTGATTDSIPYALTIAEPLGGLSIGAAVTAGLAVAVRYAAYRYKVRRTIHHAIEGLEKEHEAGLYLR